MDNVQDYLITHLPPTWVAHFTTHSTTYWRLYSFYLTVLSTTGSFIGSLLQRVRDSPDVWSVVTLGLAILITFHLVSSVYRTVVFAVRAALFVLFWGSVASLIMWIYTRGADGMKHDVDAYMALYRSELDYWQRQAQEVNLRVDRGGVRRGYW